MLRQASVGKGNIINLHISTKNDVQQESEKRNRTPCLLQPVQTSPANAVQLASVHIVKVAAERDHICPFRNLPKLQGSTIHPSQAMSQKFYLRSWLVDPKKHLNSTTIQADDHINASRLKIQKHRSSQTRKEQRFEKGMPTACFIRSETAQCIRKRLPTCFLAIHAVSS